MYPSTERPFSRISSQHRRALRGGQFVEEDVVALQRDEHRHAERLLDGRDDAGQERVGEQHHVRLLVRQELDELLDLLRLLPVRALQHGDREVAEFAVLGADREPRHPLEQPAEVEEPVEQPGRVAEQPELLFEVDVDAAEEDAPLRRVGLVGADGGVGGDEQRVVAEGAQGGDERVVAHATAAVHARGPGGDERDPHPQPRPGILGRSRRAFTPECQGLKPLAITGDPFRVTRQGFGPRRGHR